MLPRYDSSIVLPSACDDEVHVKSVDHDVKQCFDGQH